MIADLKPYADYKDSGVSWLGKVPAHWQIVRSKRLFTARQELARPDDVQLSATQAYGVIAQSLYEERTGYRVVKISMHLDKRRHVERDDFIISMRSFQGGLERAWSTGAIRSSYVVLKPDCQVDAAYFRYLFKSVPYIAALRATGDFIRDGQDLNYSNFCGVNLPLMPLAEQAAIARFLDWAIGRTEKTIRAKRKVIALLIEQRQAIIREAITRGVEPTVPLRDPGLAWVDPIPKHWQVISLKRVLKRLIDCEHKTAPLVETSPYRVVRTTAVRHGALRMRGTYCTSRRAFGAWTRRGRPEPGDVIFTREAPAGEACIVPEGIDVCLGQRTVLMKPNQQRLNSEMLVHMIYAGPPRMSISLATQGSTVGHFNMSDIGALTILLPPKAEQDDIVAAIRERTAALERTVTRFEGEIELLREYQIRLVADVVTGKLDVRNAAERLPDSFAPDGSVDANGEVDEAELTDEESEA